MLPTAPDFDRQDTIDQALRDDDSMLARIEYPAQRQTFWNFLLTQKVEIVSYHLHAKMCRIGEIESWISGSFNVCIPIYIYPPSDARVLIRIPLPYKVGEAKYPGNVGGKLRCEVSSYIWIQENSPDTRISRQFGCGFPDSQTVCSKTCYCSI